MDNSGGIRGTGKAVGVMGCRLGRVCSIAMCWGRSLLCSLEFLGTKLRGVRKDSWLTCPLVHITGRNLRRECPEGTLQGRLQHMVKALTQCSLCWEKSEGSPL